MKQKRTASSPPLSIGQAARGEAALLELDAWRAAAAALGRPVEVFEGETLWDLAPEQYAVWVLPSQARLSEDDLLALDSYLAGDGGAVLTGPTGLTQASFAITEPACLRRSIIA